MYKHTEKTVYTMLKSAAMEWLRLVGSIKL